LDEETPEGAWAEEEKEWGFVAALLVTRHQ
jgi:hypothetical protein